MSVEYLSNAALYHCKGMCSGSLDVFKFGEISDNIWKIMQDRDIVATEN